MIVLDTHAWVWWLTKPDKLSKKAKRAIDKADRIGLAGISVWEVAVKAESGGLRFDRPHEVWIEEALAEDSRLELLHLLPRIAIDAAKLSWDHRDPADRFIVSTARVHGAALVTSDDRIHDSRLVACIWD